jgi:hypothetical protein
MRDMSSRTSSLEVVLVCVVGVDPRREGMGMRGDVLRHIALLL